MRLTKNELSIMEILWEEKRPLLSNEIDDLCKGKKWKSSSIHILINSLLEKKAIAVAGFEKIGKHYCRTFKPLLTKEEYMVGSVIDETTLNDSVIREMMLALIQDTNVSEETLNILDGIIKDKKQKNED